MQQFQDGVGWSVCMGTFSAVSAPSAEVQQTWSSMLPAFDVIGSWRSDSYLHLEMDRMTAPL